MNDKTRETLQHIAGFTFMVAVLMLLLSFIATELIGQITKAKIQTLKETTKPLYVGYTNTVTIQPIINLINATNQWSEHHTVTLGTDVISVQYRAYLHQGNLGVEWRTNTLIK